MIARGQSRIYWFKEGDTDTCPFDPFKFMLGTVGEISSPKCAMFFSTTAAVLFSKGTVFFPHKKSALVAASAKFQ
jgi:hypothetical protein